ncbi:MAG: phage antirepressor KilAC domain-containing protein [Ruminococcus sp.]|nr:phage antirepressor KilAC domain-containing protein [Ruminococcus sp.]
MNNLININYDNSDRPTVMGRELHAALEVETRYNDWFKRMCEYGFTEGEDFYSILSKTPEGGRPSTDHQLTLSMAKELCMIQRTERGKQCRQYFISVEEAWNKPEAVIARALQMANRKLDSIKADNERLALQLKANEPFVIFAKAVETSHTSILIGDLAKLIKQNGVDIGQKRLFAWLRNNGYLIKSGNSTNMPTQRAMDMKLFEVKERSISNPDGTVMVTRTTKVTGKGQTYFINLFLNRKEGEKCD